MKSPAYTLAGIALLLAACASYPAVPPELEGCTYTKVHVDREALFTREDYEGEQLRVAVLERVATLLPTVGLQPASQEEAWRTLFASGRTMGNGQYLIDVGLRAELRLESHAFIAELTDPNFPDGGLHAAYILKAWPSDEPQGLGLRGKADDATRFLDRATRDTTVSLCRVEETLRAEGWTGIEELRDEMVAELKRARARRAAQQLTDSLDR